MRIKLGFLLSLVVLLLMLATSMQPRESGSVAAETRTPLLVELFTSEGCSSCPPADRFLEQLDHQSVPGAEMIVLSEHVDYWNHIGWRDPYSSHLYSERQGAYGKRFSLDSVYTPQMVVDGASEFVGSNTAAADKVFAKALAAPKIPVHLSLVSKGAKSLRAHLDAGTLERSFGVSEAGVYLAVALDRAESQVSSGENAGHELAHVAVVRDIRSLGVIKQGQGFSRDIQLNLEPGSANLRLIAFVQEPRQGKVLGAALLPVRPN